MSSKWMISIQSKAESTAFVWIHFFSFFYYFRFIIVGFDLYFVSYRIETHFSIHYVFAHE